MKICLVHNDYGKHSGEQTVVEGLMKLLEGGGHTVCMYRRSSTEIPEKFLGNIQAFFSGIYNPYSRRDFRILLNKERPDVIHAHNLYPFISPSILPVAKRMGIPVVMTVHNYRLVCPNGLHYSHDEVCIRCEGGNEYWCVKRNCEGSYFKSLGYALRNWWSRIRRYYLDNINVYICLTNFQRNQLVRAGVDAEKIHVLPNMVEPLGQVNGSFEGNYVGFVGRLSREKGIDTLVEVANRNNGIEFAAAGSYDTMENLSDRVPENFSLLGFCGSERLEEFYNNARFIVLPSVWYEGFPMVLLESMLREKAVVCSNIGGLPDIVEDGVTGLLARPGDAADLGEKIRILWNNPGLCKKMGTAGREKVIRDYSKQRHYQTLMELYRKAIEA